MGLSDSLPGAGLVGGVAGIAGDVLLNSGELVLSLVGFLVTSPDLWLTILIPARRLAGMVGWLPQDPLETLYVAALVLAISYGLLRAVRKWRESRD